MEERIDNEAWISAIARAACLTLGEDEYKILARELDKTLAELSTLDGVESGEQWQDHAVPLCDLRADVTGACLPRERLLSAAPSRRDGCFAVTGVFNDGGAEDAVE